MRRSNGLFTLAVLALVAPAGLGADPPTLWTAAELTWSDVPGISGAQKAHLWGDPGAGDHGTLNRWKANTKVPAVARAQDLHIVVLAGTFTIDVEGSYKQLGPRSFLRVPKGAAHAMGCEAAGECIFVIHQPGPAPAAK